MKSEDKVLDAKEVIYYMKKRIVEMVIVIFLINIMAISVNIFAMKTPVYKIEATIFVGKDMNNESLEYQNTELAMYEKLAETYVYMFTSRDVVNKALERAGISKSNEDVRKNTTVKPKSKTQIIELSYLTSNKEEGVNYINSLYEVSAEEISHIIKNSSVYMIESPMAGEEPINSKSRIPLPLAFIFSLFIAVIVAVVIEKRNDFIDSSKEIEDLINKPVIAEIPNMITVNREVE